MATDGVAENDLSGTSLVMYSSVPDTAGGFVFRDKSGAFSGITIGSRFSNLDGGRRGRVRYDTPEFSGFIVSAGYGTEILESGNDTNYADVALKYSADITDFKIQAAIGYAHTDNEDASDFNNTIGSFSVLHTSGFNGTVAAGDQDNNGGSYVYGKLGYQTSWFSIGKTAVSVDYYSGNDFGNDGLDSSAWGIGGVQNFDNLNLEVYVAYRDYDLDANKDASSVLVGARWKF